MGRVNKDEKQTPYLLHDLLNTSAFDRACFMSTSFALAIFVGWKFKNHESKVAASEVVFFSCLFCVRSEWRAETARCVPVFPLTISICMILVTDLGRGGRTLYFRTQRSWVPTRSTIFFMQSCFMPHQRLRLVWKIEELHFFKCWT